MYVCLYLQNLKMRGPGKIHTITKLPAKMVNAKTNPGLSVYDMYLENIYMWCWLYIVSQGQALCKS